MRDLTRLRRFLTLFLLGWLLTACGRNSVAADVDSVVTPNITSTSSIRLGIDPSQTPENAGADPTATPIPYRLQPGDLLLAASEDDIPALSVDSSDFISVEAGNQQWEREELVIGLELDGHARAYPVRLLSLHEIVNDEIAGLPVAVTWCPLCFSAITFDRRVENQTLTFGVSGYLLDSNLVMFDRQSGTLWSQLLGQGIRGGYRNQWLEPVPSRLTTWGAWQERYPNTVVLSARAADKVASEVVDPYVGYYSSGVAGLSADGASDLRLAGKALVIGLTIDAVAKAYPLAAVQDAGVINDQVGSESILLVYDFGLESAQVYGRTVGDRPLRFEPAESPELMLDTETGSRWRKSDGLAIRGPHRGERLPIIDSTMSFWFAWSEFRPDTQLYREEIEE